MSETLVCGHCLICVGGYVLTCHTNLRAALSAAEKREARLREALAKYWTGCRKCASWLGTDGPVTPAGSWFRGCDACRELREAYRATKAALEGASAASDPKGPPDSSAVVPGAQEGEK